jgi:putative ABC transport system substrate-binding protein
MRRRDFITLLGGAAAAWPLAARAQQRALPVIGSLSSRTSQASDQQLAAMLRGLAEAGFAERRDVTVENRSAEGRYEQLP